MMMPASRRPGRRAARACRPASSSIAAASIRLASCVLGVKVDGKACQRPIPGLFKDIPGVMAAQAASMLLFQSGGVEAVWPTKEIAPAERNKCGEVRRPAACSCTLSFART